MCALLFALVALAYADDERGDMAEVGSGPVPPPEPPPLPPEPPPPPKLPPAPSPAILLSYTPRPGVAIGITFAVLAIIGMVTLGVVWHNRRQRFNRLADQGNAILQLESVAHT